MPEKTIRRGAACGALLLGETFVPSAGRRKQRPYECDVIDPLIELEQQQQHHDYQHHRGTRDDDINGVNPIQLVSIHLARSTLSHPTTASNGQSYVRRKATT